MEKYVVEFVGTFALLLTIVLSRGSALAIGGILALNVLLGGKISGGHFNPAVTSMFLMDGSITGTDAACYVAAQILGAYGALMFYKMNAKK